jgi:hypothetical protein
MRDRDDAGDEMITTAAQYLITTLEPVSRRMMWESVLMYSLAVVPVVAAAVAAMGFHYMKTPGP